MLEFTSCIVLYTSELSDEHPIQACICLFRSFHLDVSAGVSYRYLYLADVHVTIISLLYLFSQSIFLRSLFIFSVRRNKSEKQQLRVVCACSSRWLPPFDRMELSSKSYSGGLHFVWHTVCERYLVFIHTVGNRCKPNWLMYLDDKIDDKND